MIITLQTKCMFNNNENKIMIFFQTFLIQYKLLKLNLNFLITLIHLAYLPLCDNIHKIITFSL